MAFTFWQVAPGDQKLSSKPQERQRRKSYFPGSLTFKQWQRHITVLPSRWPWSKVIVCKGQSKRGGGIRGSLEHKWPIGPRLWPECDPQVTVLLGWIRTAHWRTLPLRSAFRNHLPHLPQSCSPSENCPRSTCGSSVGRLPSLLCMPPLSPFSHLTKERHTLPTIPHLTTHTVPRCENVHQTTVQKETSDLREKSHDSKAKGDFSKKILTGQCHSHEYCPNIRQECHGCHQKTVSWMESNQVNFFLLSESNSNLTTGLTVRAGFAHDEIRRGRALFNH